LEHRRRSTSIRGKSYILLNVSHLKVHICHFYFKKNHITQHGQGFKLVLQLNTIGEWCAFRDMMLMEIDGLRLQRWFQEGWIFEPLSKNILSILCVMVKLNVFMKIHLGKKLNKIWLEALEPTYMMYVQCSHC
jgi:hypothetical protein